MPRPRTSDDTDLIHKAMHLFWRQGYGGTGIRHLEHELGLKAPGIYHRFGAKDALYRLALAHYLESVVSWRIQHYLVEQPPLIGLRRFFDSTYDYVDSTRPALACFLVTTSLELGAADPLVADVLREGARRLRQGFRQHLERASSAGLISRQQDLDAWVSILHMSLQGILVSSKVAATQVHLKQQVDDLFTLLTAGNEAIATKPTPRANPKQPPTRDDLP